MKRSCVGVEDFSFRYISPTHVEAISCVCVCVFLRLSPPRGTVCTREEEKKKREKGQEKRGRGQSGVWCPSVIKDQNNSCAQK